MVVDEKQFVDGLFGCWEKGEEKREENLKSSSHFLFFFLMDSQEFMRAQTLNNSIIRN